MRRAEWRHGLCGSRRAWLRWRCKCHSDFRKYWRQALRNSSGRVRCSSFWTRSICLAIAGGSEMVSVFVVLMGLKSWVSLVVT